MIFPEEESVISDGHRSSRVRDTNNTFIGEIDGRFSFSGSPADDYVRVDVRRHLIILGTGFHDKQRLLLLSTEA